jgi:hypothetical protein
MHVDDTVRHKLQDAQITMLRIGWATVDGDLESLANLIAVLISSLQFALDILNARKASKSP